MKKGTKIVIGVGLLIGVAVVGYFIWKTVSKKNGSTNKSVGTSTDVSGAKPIKKAVLNKDHIISGALRDKLTQLQNR